MLHICYIFSKIYKIGAFVEKSAGKSIELNIDAYTYRQTEQTYIHTVPFFLPNIQLHMIGSHLAC